MIGKERQATQEALAVLSESLEALGGPKRDGEDSDKAKAAVEEASETPQDISAMLKAEVDDLKDKSKQDFLVRDMGLPSSVFLACNFSSPSPSDIVYHALDTVRNTQQNKCRFCFRWFPVEYSCRADIESIQAMGKEVCKEFGEDKGRTEKTFSVDIEFRAKPKELERLDVIDAFAKNVSQPPWKVDLTTPDLTVLVNVVKGTCGCAVVREYRALKRYNLTLLAQADGEEDEKEEAKTDDKE